MENITKKINLETVKAAKKMFEGIIDESDRDFYWSHEGEYVFQIEWAIRDWYIANKSTVPLALRTAVLAVFVAMEYPDGCEPGLPATADVFKVLPKVAERMRKKKRIWIHHVTENNTWQKSDKPVYSYWLRAF